MQGVSNLHNICLLHATNMCAMFHWNCSSGTPQSIYCINQHLVHQIHLLRQHFHTSNIAAHTIILTTALAKFSSDIFRFINNVKHSVEICSNSSTFFLLSCVHTGAAGTSTYTNSPNNSNNSFVFNNIVIGPNKKQTPSAGFFIYDCFFKLIL